MRTDAVSVGDRSANTAETASARARYPGSSSTVETACETVSGDTSARETTVATSSASARFATPGWSASHGSRTMGTPYARNLLTIPCPAWLIERMLCFNGVVASVGSRGDSYDNALAESIIGLYKTELVRNQGPWR